MAERNGGALRRVLLSADCLSESAIFFGSAQVNTPSSSSSALLSLVTLPDQRESDDDLAFIAIRYTSNHVGCAVRTITFILQTHHHHYTPGYLPNHLDICPFQHIDEKSSTAIPVTSAPNRA